MCADTEQFLCVDVYGSMYTTDRSPQVLQRHFSGAIHFIFWDRVSPETWDLLSRLDQQDLVSVCLFLLSAGNTSTCPHTQPFCIGSLHLQGKYFTKWAVFQASVNLFYWIFFSFCFLKNIMYIMLVSNSVCSQEYPWDSAHLQVKH